MHSVPEIYAALKAGRIVYYKDYLHTVHIEFARHPKAQGFSMRDGHILVIRRKNKILSTVLEPKHLTEVFIKDN